MAQIIKHRRGSIDTLKGTTARNGELIIASGSISDLGGPFVFIGSPNVGDEGVAGAFRPVSKIYTGTAAPSLAAATYGSILDGTPFYATSNKSLYVLNNSGAGGNTRIDLTGNIENNTINSVTINNISGSTRLNGDLYITGNTIQTGSIDLTGNVTLGGNIYIGNQTTDLVVFQGEVSSSILPEVNNAFDLGAPSQAWRDLYVSGTAHVGTLDVGTMSLSGITVFEDLVVNGNTYLGNSGSDNVFISGSTYVGTLTDNRVVIAGTDGLLEDDANFTFDGTTLKVGDGDFEVDVLSGNTRMSGSLLVKDTATVSGSLSVDGHINLTNEAQIRITDDTANTIYGFYDGSNILGPYYQMFGNDYSNAGQRGSAEFVYDTRNGGDGNFHVASYDGSTWVQRFRVDDNGVQVTGSLNVTSTSELQGAVGINSSLDVTGSATLKSTLEVKGATGLNSSLDVTGSTTLKSTLEVKGATGLNSSLDVTGSAQFKDTINVDGEATLASAIVEDLTQDRIVTVGAGGALIDSSGFTYNGTVFKIGNGNFEVDTTDGDIRTSGSLTVEGGQTINGDVTVNGVLTVTGNTQLQSNLYVSGNLEVLGSSTNVIIQSQTVEIDDNIIRMNAYSPFLRYAGFEVNDSGSSGVSASVLWDSQNDYWLFVSASGQASKFVGTTAGTFGSETSLTVDTIPKGTGANNIGDSLLTDNGTTLSYNINKFQVTASNGDTTIAGNVTLSYSGGTDNGTKTSAVVFKNSSNILGYVSTTESTDVLDGILGYKNSDGTLKFSTVIDGGGY